MKLRNYEVLIIIKPNLDMEEVDKVLAKIEETVKDFGGNVLNIEKTGSKVKIYNNISKIGVKIEAEG